MLNYEISNEIIHITNLQDEIKRLGILLNHLSKASGIKKSVLNSIIKRGYCDIEGYSRIRETLFAYEMIFKKEGK